MACLQDVGAIEDVGDRLESLATTGLCFSRAGSCDQLQHASAGMEADVLRCLLYSPSRTPQTEDVQVWMQAHQNSAGGPSRPDLRALALQRCQLWALDQN